MNDPYVAKAYEEGYNSRAAFKLLEIQEKFNIFRPKMKIIDLGAAPGGWCQVALKLTNVDPASNNRSIIAIDLLEFEQIPGVYSIVGDFNDNETKDKILTVLDLNKADIVMSDMAANTTGHKHTDHLRIISLCEEALFFALQILVTGGHFIAKILQGGASGELLEMLQKNFTKVKYLNHNRVERNHRNFI